MHAPACQYTKRIRSKKKKNTQRIRYECSDMQGTWLIYRCFGFAGYGNILYTVAVCWSVLQCVWKCVAAEAVERANKHNVFLREIPREEGIISTHLLSFAIMRKNHKLLLLWANICAYYWQMCVHTYQPCLWLVFCSFVVKMNQDSGSANDVKTKVGTKYQVLTNTWKDSDLLIWR